MDPTFPLVPVVNFVGCFLVFVTFVTMRSRPWNTGVCMFGIWIFLVGLETGVNTTVYANNVKDVAPIWCDISSHLNICSEVAIPACSLVITRRLCNIVNMRNNVITQRWRLMERLGELFFCLFLPIIIAALYYIVQGARYEILEELGCTTSVVVSGLEMILINTWHILFPAVSLLFYSPRIIWAFYRHRKEASEILSSGETETESDFWRIFTLGCLDIILTLPVGMINIVTTVLQQGRSSTPFVFYPGWTYIHSDWWPAYVPKNVWDNGGVWTRFAVHWDEWIDPFFSLLFFALFGLTRDARTQYSCLFWGSMKFFGVMPAPQKDKVTSTIEFHSAMNDLESSTEEYDKCPPEN